jgi:trigger factor
MSVQVEETGPVERRLRVDVPTARVDAAFDAVYRTMGRQVRVPGFRPGKVPRSVLERMLGERARGEVMERLLRDSLPGAIEEAELALVGEPRLTPGEEPKQGSPYSYEVTVEIRPEIELRKVRGLEVTRPELPEPDEDPVEHYLGELREAHAQLAEEPEGTTAARGRVAIVDYEGTCDGEPFDGGSGQGATIEIGSGRAIPGFEEQLEGMAAGGEREFDLDLPEGYPVAELAGKRAHFRVQLVGLKRKELPELDDEFAKDVSEFDTLQAFRDDLNRRVEEGREKERERALREAVARKLVEENPFPVPPSLVERQLSMRIARAASQLGRELPEERLRELVSRWREEWRPQTEQSVALSMLVHDVAKAERIEVSGEDVDTRLREIAEQRDTTVTKLRRESRDTGLVEGIEASLLEERVLEFLVSAASVTD